MPDPNVIHRALDEWVNALDADFILDHEAESFVGLMKAERPDDWAVWLEAVASSLVIQHMRAKVGIRRRNARKAAILGVHLARAGKEIPGAISAASLFASQAVSIQSGDGRYASLRHLTKGDLLRIAASHEGFVKGHLRSASLHRRLAALLPTDDAMVCDYISDDKIAELAADAEEMVG